MKYSQYPYERINLEEFKNNIQAMIINFNSADSADEQIEIINNYQNVQKKLSQLRQYCSLKLC